MLAESELKGLLGAVARGNHAALKKIYTGYGAHLFGGAMAILRDRAEAGDALQDCFLKIWEQARQFDPARVSAETWIASVLRLCALDIARARGREIPIDAKVGAAVMEPGALDALAARDDGGLLRAQLQKLEPKTRQGIVLAFVHGLSVPELASRLDLPLTSVRNILVRGLGSLQQAAVNDAPPSSEVLARDIAAGQYVLGTLDRREAVRVAAAFHADPLWRQAVESWETLLTPLARLARPETPPPDAWDRIEARVMPQRSPRQRRAWRVAWLWRLWAISASAAAISSVLFVVQLRRPVAHVGTVLVTDRNAPALVAEVDPKTNNLRLAAFSSPSGRNLHAPSEKELQIWALVPGSQQPMTLGLMPHEPGPITIIQAPKSKLVAGSLLEISLEPVGGSPLPHPAGQVVFFGRLGDEPPQQ